MAAAAELSHENGRGAVLRFTVTSMRAPCEATFACSGVGQGGSLAALQWPLLVVRLGPLMRRSPGPVALRPRLTKAYLERVVRSQQDGAIAKW